tara:strand:- start:1514 stop:1750 length:237 start_codon:yes stop_codon:yes gene_type:complete
MLRTLETYLIKVIYLTTNSVVGANVIFGRAVHIDSNVITKKVIIGDYSLIGVGAVFLNNVNINCVAVNNPTYALKNSN